MKVRIWLLLAILLTTAATSHAEIMNVLIAKEIDDDNIIVLTENGEKLLLKKWSIKFSPLVFEGKVFPADVSSMWVKMFIEGKGEIKWSIEKHLGMVELDKPKQSPKSLPAKKPASEGYLIEVAHNDELFIINGEKYKAKTYCLGWEKGEQVIFLEGSALGACSSAKLLNVERRSVCEVWCE